MITLGVEWPQGAEQQAEKDLGFKFNVQPMSTNAQVQKSITAPRSFDILGGYNYQFFQIWPTGNFQPVDRTKIRAWNRLLPGLHQGQGAAGPQGLHPRPGQRALPRDVRRPGRQHRPAPDEGRAAHQPADRPVVERRHEQGDSAASRSRGGSSGRRPTSTWTRWATTATSSRRRPPQVSWAELLNARHKGRVAVLNDPGIAMADLGNAVQALGLMKFKNLGNMTRGEMDRLFTILARYKKAGHFRALLVDVQRVGEPDGLEGGRDRVDVVAGRGAARRAGRQLPLRVPEGGHAWLVQRAGHPEARHRREARRPPTTT